MSSGTALTGVIRQLAAPPGDDPADADLLTRYVRANDEAAFAAVVRRYGGLVLGVARRQLADPHRADDVFQATFLALARSARRLGSGSPLANWLYTVALRQARKARGRDLRRETVERAVPANATAADPLDEISGRELLRVIDEELARLPDRLRLPVLLCCVQGLGRDEAARRLGWTAGAVKGRLERGRRRLADRLAARGLAPSAVVLAPLGAVAVPNDLLAGTVGLAAEPWSKAVPPAVAALAAPGRKLLPLAAVAGSVLAVGLAGWALAAGGTRPAEVAPPPAPAPVVPPMTPPAVAAAAPADDDPLPAGTAMRLGTSRFRHPSSIETFVVSADGTVGVAGSGQRRDAGVRGYDLATGRAVFALDKNSAFVDGVGLSPDGQTLATKRNHTVFLYDLATGREIEQVPYPSQNPSSNSDWMVFTADGKRLAIGAATGTDVHVIDVPGRKVLRTFEHSKTGNAIFGAAFSPDGTILAGAGYDREGNAHFVPLWDVETGKELRRCATGNAGNRTVAFSPDGTVLAVGSDSGRVPAVRLFDVATGKELRTIQYPDGYSIRSLTFAPDGKTVAAGGYRNSRLFDVATGREVLKIDRRAVGLRFAPDGKSLVGAVGSAIVRWDAATGAVLTPAGGDSTVAQVELTPDGKQVVTLGQEGDAHVWDAATGKHLRGFAATWQRGLGMTPDGRFLAWPVADEKVQFKDPKQPNAIHTGSRLRLYDLAAGTFVDRFGGFEGDAHDLHFAAGGKTLVTLDHRDAAVRVWDVAAGKEVRLFRAVRTAEADSRHVAWRSRLSPDGTVLAVTYQRFDRTTALVGPYPVRVWDVATGKELFELQGHLYYVEGVAFSPDGKFLATASEPLQPFIQERLTQPADQLYVWDVKTGKMAARLPAGGTAAAFAPDGKTLATAAPDGTIQLWDVATWALRKEVTGHTGRVSALTFAPDGRLLAGGIDTTVLVWDAAAVM